MSTSPLRRMAHRSTTTTTTADPAAAVAMADAATISKEEQARKAHALAEKCFLAGNVSGARQWMQSAVRLAPDLPGTAQAVAAYDVHAAAARRPHDWYAVLGLQPGPGGAIAHDDVKRRHRRLCLLVHPDKNPCAAAAADGAFKLVQAAWHALSARHPPSAAAPAPPANKPQPPPQPPPPPRPPPPPPPPRPPPPPKPRPRPQVVQMPRRAAATAARPRPKAAGAPSYAEQASKPKPPERRSTAPSPNTCPACGACTPNGKGGFRCGSCQWSPFDNRQDDDDEDFFEEDYY